MTTLAPTITAVAQAIEETVTTPMPGLGHGRLANVVALLVFALLTLHLV